MKRRWFAYAIFLSASIAAMAQDPTTNTARWRRVSDPAPTAAAPAVNANDNPIEEQAATSGNNPTMPGEVVLPAGTWINVRIDQLLSSDYNRVGDIFAATLSQPVVAGGTVIARRGQTISGRVTESVRAGRIKGTSRLGIELSELSLADGQQIPIRSQLVEFSAGGSRGQDTATVATVTGAGAAIGAGAAGGFGAGMGAIAGAGASAIGVLLSRGRVTEVPPESVLRFRLLEPLTVNTSRTQQAFQTVRQDDYEPRGLQQRVQVRQPQNQWGSGLGYYSPWFWGPSYGYGFGWGPSFYSNRYWGGGGGYYRGGGGNWGRGGRGGRR